VRSILRKMGDLDIILIGVFDIVVIFGAGILAEFLYK